LTIKLDTPAEQVDVNAPAFAAMLQNLQANILKPHGRDFARHIFLKFVATPAEVKRWIQQQVAPHVTSAKQQFEASAKRSLDPNGSFDGGLSFGFFLSARGYGFLGFDTSVFGSESFQKGMKDQHDGVFSKLLDLDNEDPPVSSWEPPFRQEIHALVTLADDTLARVEGAAAELRQSAATVAQVLSVEEGNVLRRAHEPVEHFGYFDGISQPLFTKQDVDANRQRNPNTEAWNPSARLSLVLVDDPLTQTPDAFGSYLVYRKLGQNVPLFVDTVAKLAQSLGADADLAGAYVVGRFKDGTPVELAKHKDAELSKDNDFNFDKDSDGVRCPFHAHIRKVNPRGTTPLTTLASEKRRRIARRGIPYGPPVTGAADNLPPNDDPNAERGLLFMCFQANIEDQFEFIQRTWVDNKHFPTSVLSNGLLHKDTGDDPLIGQDRDEAQRWPKAWGDKHGGKKTINFDAAVELEGGEYLFAPSLPFIKSL
jgi:Dyp-type peroxidase family